MSTANPVGSAALFDRQAGLYSVFRPTYPPELYDALAAYAGAHGTGSSTLAADIACGSGQASLDLAKTFTRVIGVDASSEQVAKAPPAANVEFRLGTAERTSLADASCDLVAVAQAFHWFNVEPFFTEAHRILKPHGTLAIWCYAMGKLDRTAYGAAADAAASRVFEQCFDGVLKGHWDARRALVDAEYVGMEPHAPLFALVQRQQPLPLSKEMPLSGLIGYVRTWSGYNTFLAVTRTAKETAADPAAWLRRQLVRIYTLGADVAVEPYSPAVAVGGAAANEEAEAALEAERLAADAIIVRVAWPMALILATKA